MRRRRWIAAVAVIAAAIAAWGIAGAPRLGTRPIAATGAAEVGATPHHAAPKRIAAVHLPNAPAGTITISGQVIDELDGSPVGSVEVVFRSPLGDAMTTAAPNGTYAIVVAPGTYRAFTRDAVVMSIGVPDRARINLGPLPGTAGVPDEALMPVIVATADTGGVELGVIHGATISGRVTDPGGRALRGVIVRAIGSGARPVLGDDVAETATDGMFELHVAPGRYVIDARYPGFGRALGEQPVALDAGNHATIAFQLVAGCAINGRVVAADGRPANDGALERLRGDVDGSLSGVPAIDVTTNFAPAGHVEPDGTFHWFTIDEGDVVLRAWPWQSPPSPSRHFACHAGARYDDVVFHLPEQEPDLEGVIVDATGAPVPLAYLDVAPLDNDAIGQQERGDAAGHWAVYDLILPRRYQLTAIAPGRGAVVATVSAPQHGQVRLQLAGTGRIAGTTTALANGSLEVSFHACQDVKDPRFREPLALPHQPQLVTVTNGQFVLDDVPACDVVLEARWRGKTAKLVVPVAANDTAHIELDLGPAREKSIHGIVRDSRGQPIANARVTAVYEGREAATVRTDDAGRYALTTYSGAKLVSGDGDRVGSAAVGRANVADEQVDLVIGQ